jgi:hypothetical protein
MGGNGMGWDGMGWDEMGGDGMGWDGRGGEHAMAHLLREHATEPRDAMAAVEARREGLRQHSEGNTR